jgi:hypothetical protein
MQCYNTAMQANKAATLLDCYTWSSKTFTQQDATQNTYKHTHKLKTQAKTKLAQLQATEYNCIMFMTQ